MKSVLIICMAGFVFMASCKKDSLVGSTGGGGFTICANSCSNAQPWRVESLDLGLPCFSTQQQCQQWAGSNGYGDKPCVKCN